MSAFKGTPGPWTVGEDGDVIWAERWKGTILHVATVPFSKEPRVGADARMIAAAPDSHNANVLFIEAIDCLYNITLAWPDDRIYDELPSSGLALAYFSARSAIAKATGEQP